MNDDLASGHIAAKGPVHPVHGDAVAEPAGEHGASIMIEGVVVLLRWVVLPESTSAAARAPPIQQPTAFAGHRLGRRLSQ
ncbi:hypothetical protein [Modestobacter excelsi]|uniref:hypothetical protein n=1 Tax=Modestobacter excelsi TaxID=2213161 RepID=UPI00110CA9A3|nr:hypothetical protein [Modestobacter excelsi]